MNHIIVTGCRRSGTTFLGNALNCATSTAYVEEPFNKLFGIKSIPNFWYPYLTEEVVSSRLNQDINSLFNLRHVSFRNSVCNSDKDYFSVDAPTSEILRNVFIPRSNEKFIRRVGRLFFKSNHYTSYLKTRFFCRETILWKDPLMALAIKYLLKVTDSKVVLIYRHPAAYYQSMKRQGWNLEFENFKNQSQLLEDNPEFQKHLEQDESEFNRIVTEWIIVNEYLMKFVDNERVICVSHEDISLDTRKKIEEVYDKFGIKTEIDIKKLKKITESDRKVKAVKDIRRNSSSVASSWKLTIDNETMSRIMAKAEKTYGKLEKLKL